MKRAFTLVLLLMTSVVLFSSCQKDEDKIIGTWNMDANKSTEGGMPYAYFDMTIQLSFYENGTYSGYLLDEGYYNPVQGTYMINGNQLILDHETIGTIEELTRKKLVYNFMNGNGRMVHWEFDKVK